MENRTIKILAIDDNQDNLVTLKALLKDTSPDALLLMATSGVKGLETAASEKPDVILLDVIMPGMDGFEVCRKLKADAALCDIPVVFVTAIKGDKESRILALESGAEAFLSKPIDESELTAQIRAMLKISKANFEKRNEKERLSALVEERTSELQKKNLLNLNLLEDIRTEMEVRKKTEMELRLSEEKFSKSFYTSPDSIIINRLDDGKIVEVNSGFRRITGYEESEVIGKTTAELNLYINPEERNAIIHELKTTGQVKDFECWFATKNGLPILGLLSAVTIDINGIKHILSTTRDITERKQAEEALKLSEGKYRQLVNNTDTGFVVVDEKGVVVEANDPYLKLAGYGSFEEISGRSVLEWTAPDEVENNAASIALGSKQGYVQNFETVYLRADGTRINIILDATLQSMPDGRKLHVAFCRDITERKRVEEALQKSETEFRQLAEAMPQIVWITRPDGWNIFFNQQWVKYTGQTLEESCGNGWNKPFHPDDQQRASDAWQNATTNLTTYSLECRLRRFDGEYKWWLIRGVPIFDDNGAVAKWYGTCTDINERKQAEALLIESEKRNRGILANLDAGIVIHAPDTSIVLSNPKAAELLGLSELQMQGKLSADPGWQFIDEHKKPLPLSEYPVNQIKSHKKILKEFIIGVCRPVTNDVVWLMVNGFPVLDKNGEISEILISFIDLTDRKQAADLLQKSEEKYRTIFENVQDVFYQTDLAGTVVEMSPSIYNLCAYKREELIGCKASVLYNKPDERGLLVNAILRNGELWDYELELKTKSGKIKFVSINARLIKDNEGRPTHIDGAIRDISERRLAVAKLKESEEFSRYLLQTIPFGMDIVDEKGTILFRNENLKKLCGEELIGSKCWEVYRDDKQQCSDCPLKAGINLGKTEVYESSGVLGGKTFEVIHTGISHKGKEAMLEIFIDITGRKLAERELIKAKENAEESEEKYRLAEIDLLEAQRLANIGSWHWDLKTGLVAWSKELCTINGHNPDIPVPAFADMASYYTPESWKVVNEAVARTFTTGEPYNLDFEMVKPDGTVIFTNTRGCANYDEAGEMVNLHGTVQDITERKQLEDVHAFLSTSGYPGSNENFFESLAKYLAQILDSEYVCIDKLEGDGLTAQTVAIYNEGKFDANVSYTLRQTPCGEVVGKTICCFPENVCQLFPQDEALQELKAHSYIGTTLWSFEGKPIGLIAIIGQKPLKNTAFAESVLKLVAIRAAGELERMQTEEKLLRSEKELVRAQEITHIGSWYLDVATNQVVWTQELYKMYGFDPAFPPPPYTEHQKLFTPESWATLSTSMSRTRETGIPYELELKTVKTDGSNGWMWVRGETERNREGKTIGLWGAAQDITERKLAEVELLKARDHAEESDRLKSAFLANMSHEIRTPMNGILGFAELLKMPGLTGEQQQEYIAIIKKSGDRMLNIINNIVDISKIESGQMTLNVTETNINETLEFVYNFFEPEVKVKGIELLINHKLPADQTVIETDREKIYAILTNLVKNAIKFSDSGTIRIGSRLKGKFLEFYVTDKGIGIPQARQQAIFERFIQADISDKRAFQGAGLGLSISKAYAEMLGGRMWVESLEGEGSTFYFSIPYKTKKELNAGVWYVDPEEVNFKENKKLKVLVVEDDEISQRLVNLAVQKISKEVLSVNSGIAAVEICRKTPDIDLILMDIKMPVMDGYETTEQIRRFNKETVIIAQTAFGLSGDKEKALAAGCNDYIAKPLNIAMLTKLIQTHFNMF